MANGDNSGRYVGGILLILLGVVFLLPGIGLPYLGWHNIWPLFIMLGGVSFIIGWLVSTDHDPGLAFVGTGGLLIGGFLALFAWGILGWWEMGRMWPAFPLIGGVCFLVLWAAGRCREHGILVPAVGGILTGLVAFAFTLGYGAEIIVKWWPVAIIALGVAVLAGQFLTPKKD